MASHICQIAVCSTDHRRSTDFYASVLDMDHIFGTTSFRGVLPEMVQGMKNAASTTRWLIDDRKLFQLEVFQFETPTPKPLAADHNITHEGYNRIIVAVKSIEATAQLAEQAGYSVTRPDVEVPNVSHAWMKDPDGVLIELVEMPERIKGQRNAQMIGLGITTLNLELSVEDMREGFEFTPCEDLFEHALYWNEGDELEKHQTLQLADMFLVVSQYRNSTPRPKDYQLADIGIMNFALIHANQTEFMKCYERVVGMGMKPNCDPVLELLPGLGIVYNNDRQGFSVEMMYMNKYLGLFGFSRPGLLDHVMNFIAELKAKFAYPRHIAHNK